MGTGELNAGASHPAGSRNTPSRFMLRKPISSGLMGHLARMQTLPLPTILYLDCRRLIPSL